MSATISDASHRASGATDCRVTVQLLFAAAGHADDVEFDVAAQRMPIERKAHPPPDFLEGRRGFGKIPIEIHFAPPHLRSARPWRRDHPLGLLLGPIWLTAR